MNQLLFSKVFSRRLLVTTLYVAIATILPVCLSQQAKADTIAIGTLSFDLVAASAQFTVIDYTGPNSLSPDLPVIDTLLFTNLSIQYFLSSGASAIITSSDISPTSIIGPFGGTQFDAAASITQAIITGTLNETTFQVDFGSGPVTYRAGSPTFSATLFPSAGSTLTAGVDVTAITVAAEPVATPEPCPAYLISLSAVCLCTIGMFKKRRS